MMKRYMQGELAPDAPKGKKRTIGLGKKAI